MADLKVKAGDPVSAKAWNQVVDLLPASKSGFGAGLISTARTTITVKNVSGADRDIGEILTIGDWDGAPDATKPYAVLGTAAFEADEITWPTGIGKPVVLADPIPDGERGLGVIAGPCLIKLKSGESDNSYVFFDVSTPTQFVTADAGIARVLHKFASENYAVAVMGDRQLFFRYQLSEGSLAPSSTTATLENLDGTPITNATVEIEDPQSLMSDQTTGDEGICFLAGDEFHAIQASCA